MMKPTKCCWNTLAVEKDINESVSGRVNGLRIGTKKKSNKNGDIKYIFKEMILYNH